MFTKQDKHRYWKIKYIKAFVVLYGQGQMELVPHRGHLVGIIDSSAPRLPRFVLSFPPCLTRGHHKLVPASIVASFIMFFQVTLIRNHISWFTYLLTALLSFHMALVPMFCSLKGFPSLFEVLLSHVPHRYSHKELQVWSHIRDFWS